MRLAETALLVTFGSTVLTSAAALVWCMVERNALQRKVERSVTAHINAHLATYADATVEHFLRDPESSAIDLEFELDALIAAGVYDERVRGRRHAAAIRMLGISALAAAEAVAMERLAVAGKGMKELR